MGKASAPDTPDYEGAAKEQGEEARWLAQQQNFANRPDQYNPWGSTTWQQETFTDPSTGKESMRWIQNQQMNPIMQGILDYQMQGQLGQAQLANMMQGQVAQSFGQPMDYSQFGGQQQLDFDPTQMRQRAEDSIYQQGISRLNPQFEGQRQSAEIALRNKGLRPGDQAYESEMNRINMQQNDARTQLQGQALQAGQGESAQLWQQQMGGSQYANQLRQNAMQEAMQQRYQPYNEWQAMSGGGMMQNPFSQGFMSAGSAAPTDRMGAMQAQYGADMGQYNAGQAGWQGMMQGAMGLGGLFMMCDRRLKKHIKRIGEILGYPLYAFQYVWGEWGIGPMSDEVNKDAVFKHPWGYDMVDLSKLEQAHG